MYSCARSGQVATGPYSGRIMLRSTTTLHCKAATS
ncbi:toxin-antitoxin system HicB family antitoxin [Pontibacter virosus]